MSQARKARAVKLPVTDVTPVEEAANQPIAEPMPEAKLLLDYFEQAHIGKRKKEQQDCHGHLILQADPARNLPSAYLFVVADGVSMGEGGALAAQTAVDDLLQTFEKLATNPQADYCQNLYDAATQANTNVYKMAQTRAGMATTVVAVLVYGNQLVTLHLGDSRAYLLGSTGELKVLTTDHSWLVEIGRLLVDQNLLTEADLKKDQRRHTLSRAVGSKSQVDFDVTACTVQPGDRFLICSDGLWDLIEDDHLKSLLLATPDSLSETGNALVNAALEASGRDNITVVLANITATDEAHHFPALPQLLKTTAQDLVARTRPVELSPDLRYSSVIAPLSSQANNPPIADGENPAIEDVPSLKLSSMLSQPELMLTKAQQNFALGNWDEALDDFIELEQYIPTLNSLYESFSSVLVRYVGFTIGEGKLTRAELLLKRLETKQIKRYHELLADYSLDEGMRASVARHFQAAKSYAQFCLGIRPAEQRAHKLQELCESYLALQRPGASLSERLSLGQRIYARDEDFGNIQNDLARIYLELGDEASRRRKVQDAQGWYGLVKTLRPGDTELLVQAGHRLRIVEDEAEAIQAELEQERADRLVQSVTYPTEGTVNGSPPPRTTVLTKADQELIARLKERIIRAQKAWDSGRKEVGSEYIYLVEQLNDLLDPNSWQSIQPRVCYEYGKWLLEQRQPDEARPYLVKAQQMGMAAAGQRLREADRLLHESKPSTRFSNELSQSLLSEDKPSTNSTFAARTELPGASASLLDPYTRNPNDITGGGKKKNSPLVPPRPEPPQDTRHVGATGNTATPVDGSNNAGNVARPNFVTSNRNNDTPTENPTLGAFAMPITPPRSAATLASGNWSAADMLFPPPGNNDMATGNNNSITNREQYATENPTGERASHFVRPKAEPLAAAAAKISGAFSGGNKTNDWQSQARRSEIWNFVRGVLAPGLAIGIVGLALIVLLVQVVPGALQSFQQSQQTTPTAQPTTNPATTSTVEPVAGVQGIVRLKGVKVDDMRAFLAEVSNPTTPFRELTQENDYFRLSAITLNKLDPRQKYVIVLRPRDTNDRKYVEGLPLNSPALKPFLSSDFNFDPVKGFETELNIIPEVVGFYPLRGGETDVDILGGRYFAATKHTVRGEYLKYFNANGAVARYGFPISEEFEWTGNGRVQFFERGWLSVSTAGQPVANGTVGRALLATSCNSFPRVPASTTPVAIPTLRPDAAFTSLATSNRLGAPQTIAFEVGPETSRYRYQYFESGRLELNLSDPKAPPTLGLLGNEYARCVGWFS